MMRLYFGALKLLAVVAVLACFLMIQSVSYASAESDNARDQAKKILQDEKFGKESERPLSKDAQRITRWLGENAQDEPIPERTDEEIKQQSEPNEIPSLTPPVVGNVSGFVMVIFYSLIAVVFAAVGYLIFKTFKNRTKKPKSDDDGSEEELDIDWSEEEKVLEFITDADLLEKMSEQAEQAGQFDLALRYRFRAGLLKLNDMEIITFHPAITNAQWQLLINNEGFNSLTKDFNDVTYGEQPCDAVLLSKARQGWSSLVGTKSGRAK